MKKKTKITISIICALVMAFSITGVALADTQTWNSKGRIVFSGADDTPDTADDIIFDSADLNTIHDEVISGKTSVSTALNTKGYGIFDEKDYAGTDTFADLSSGVSNIFNLPDASTVYNLDPSRVDANGDAIEEASYAKVDAANISAGKYCYNEAGELIVGTGADNINSFEEGYTEGLAKALSANHIEYTYHKHSSACNCTGHYTWTNGDYYVTREHDWQYSGEWYDKTHYRHRCNKCGNIIESDYANDSSIVGRVCGRQTCGKTTSTIESATITMN